MSSSFSLLVVTAATSHQSSSTLAELHLRQRKGLLPPSLRVLAVPDPLGQRVGSGGCVLNSLLEAARALWWDKERARKAQRWREPRSLAVGEGEEFGVEREKKERLMNTVRKNTGTEGLDWSSPTSSQTPLWSCPWREHSMFQSLKHVSQGTEPLSGHPT
eukprot:GHVQ01028383.1.p1 GENE.GHVQ01028383.1~~GHVQ01028383.1.p1  ORF type:complete len:160 (+),score=19.53 GHVQ01028383.1:223-702(+)